MLSSSALLSHSEVFYSQKQHCHWKEIPIGIFYGTLFVYDKSDEKSFTIRDVIRVLIDDIIVMDIGHRWYMITFVPIQAQIFQYFLWSPI